MLHFFAGEHLIGSTADLWRTDGTAAGTVKVAAVNVAESVIAAVAGDRLFFTGKDPVNGAELWAYDGTATGVVADLVPGSAGSGVMEFCPIGDRLYARGNLNLTHPASET